jgi:chorismate mutase
MRVLCALVAVLAVASAALARADTSSSLLELVDAAAQRLQTADPVAASKWISGMPIDDPPRVQQVLAAVTTDARAHQVDPDYVAQVFNDQIDATEAIEYSRFAQWKLDPPSAPAAPPELSASRAAIDGLNRRMVNEIALHPDVLRSPTCPAALDDARNAVTAARQLDELYQQALSFATHSYCRR